MPGGGSVQLPSLESIRARRHFLDVADPSAMKNGLEDVSLANFVELLEPESVADAVAYLLGPAGRFATGSPHVLDGGWTAR